MSYRESSIKLVQEPKPHDSNVQLRSNVYLRQCEVPLREDKEFLRRVRGLKAIRKLLGYFGLQPEQQRHDDVEILRLVQLGKLSPAQQNALKWELVCTHCHSIPCGETFNGKLEFRCECDDCPARKTSSSSASVPRRILVPIPDLQQCREDLSQILSRAINQCCGVVPEIDLQPPFYPQPIRVSPEHIRYNDQQLATFLVYGIRQSRVR